MCVVTCCMRPLRLHCAACAHVTFAIARIVDLSAHATQAINSSGAEGERTAHLCTLLRNTAALGVAHVRATVPAAETLVGFADILCEILHVALTFHILGERDRAFLPRMLGGCTFVAVLRDLPQACKAAPEAVDHLVCAIGLPCLQIIVRCLSGSKSERAQSARATVAALLIHRGRNRAAFEQIGGTPFFRQLSCSVHGGVAVTAAELVLCHFREQNTALYNQCLRLVLRKAQLMSGRLALTDPVALCALIMDDFDLKQF